MNNSSEYSKMREQRRREWAALQNPELVTTQQALDMLNRSNSAGFANYMKQNNVEPLRFTQFQSANFYIKDEVETLILNNVRFIRRPYMTYCNKNESARRITFEDMNETNWTIEDFMEAWGPSETSSQVRLLLERTPSTLYLVPSDAERLMLMLSSLGGRSPRTSRFKFDKQYFLLEISRQLSSLSEQKKLAKILDSLYETTDIGIFEPSILVKILHELMVSSPKNKPSTG